MRMLPSILLAGVVAGVAATAGCGASTRTIGSETLHVNVPAEIDAAGYADAVRLYHALPLGHDDREELKRRILAYLDHEAETTITTGDYEGAVGRLREMTDLLIPEDFETRRLPRIFERIARFVRDRGAARGDEGRTLAALLLLQLLEPDEERHEQEYRQLSAWGREARAGLPNVLERTTQIVELLDEHARLTPASSVLEALARAHVERRDAALGALREDPSALFQGPSILPQQLARIVPLDVAGVYLRIGDVVGAATHVRQVGSGEAEMRLVDALESARSGGSDGADALTELAEVYVNARPDVAVGICRLGRRQHHADARFPTCLARVAAEANRFDEATAFYAEAIDLEPERKAIYDEALSQLSEFLERGLFDDDPGRARGLVRHAERILEERLRRFPGEAPPFERNELQYLIGMLEMNSGNAVEAQARLEASLQERPTAAAEVQLGILLERIGEPEGAKRHYRSALDLTPASGDGKLRRAELLEHLGDALRAARDPSQAARMYREAIAIWDEAIASLDGPPRAIAQTRRGILLDRLGRRDEAIRAFRGAIDVAPAWRDTYASILSHLVTSAPDVEFAYDVFRRAQTELPLDPEWKVYFALWVRTIGAREGSTVPNGVDETLHRLTNGEGWWSMLARFGTGRIDYATLLREAAGRAQETEAHFYEGVRLLAAGDRGGAARQFHRVLGSSMVSFYEFAMAQALIGDTVTTPATTATP